MTSAPLDATAVILPTPALPALPHPRPRLMRNSIRRYDWGSLSVLARLQGRPQPEHPEAELWMGAHPLAPSVLLDPDGQEISLDGAIAADPVGTLGTRCLERFGERLPFLLKVLAIERALSVQLHPSPEQARAGFAHEEAAGVPLDAPDRVYVDPYAKPELLCAVTHVEALAGLRTPARAGLLVDSLDLPRLAEVRAHLGGGHDVAGALQLLVAWPSELRRALVADVVTGAHEALHHGHGLDDDAEAALRWVITLADQHPNDPFVLAPLLLELHRLEPGGSLFVPAGVPHAYLSGVGVEIMASSDNVVRAGLTSKHVDQAALLELLDPAARPLVTVAVAGERAAEVHHRPPVEEFALSDVEVSASGGAVTPAGAATGSPRVVLCLTGEVEVRTGEHHVALTGGESAFLPAAAPAATFHGTAHLYLATTP